MNFIGERGSLKWAATILTSAGVLMVAGAHGNLQELLIGGAILGIGGGLWWVHEKLKTGRWLR